jgi:hypothetical protein
MPVPSWRHRCALGLSLLGLVAIVAGAVITSSEVAARQTQSAVAQAVDDGAHRALAIALIASAFGFAVWISSAGGWLRTLAWGAFAVLAIDAASGWAAPPLAVGRGIVHALLAHLYLAIMVAIVVATSAGWNREAELVDDGGWSWLRPVAIATPPAVFVQIMLGAMYRHDVTGIMPHMAGAMIVALVTVVVSAVVLQNFTGPAALRRSAVWLISIVLTQVCLGIAALLMLVLNFAGTLVFVVSTAGHVAIGAATLSASVVMAMEVGRSVRPASLRSGA